MRKSQFTDQQIVAALRQAEHGSTVGEVCRKLGVTEQTFSRWKRKFAGMGVHSLQVADKLSAHTPGWLPTADFFGVFPTWETTIMQLVIVAVTAVGFALTSGSHEPNHASRAASGKPASLAH